MESGDANFYYTKNAAQQVKFLCMVLCDGNFPDGAANLEATIASPRRTPLYIVNRRS